MPRGAGGSRQNRSLTRARRHQPTTRFARLASHVSPLKTYHLESGATLRCYFNSASLTFFSSQA